MCIFVLFGRAYSGVVVVVVIVGGLCLRSWYMDGRFCNSGWLMANRGWEEVSDHYCYCIANQWLVAGTACTRRLGLWYCFVWFAILHCSSGWIHGCTRAQTHGVGIACARR